MKISFVLMCCFLLGACTQSEEAVDHLNLEPRLSGKWTASAFSGELHEEWILNHDGWMQQDGYYIEGSDTSYAAKTRIQQVGDDIILFSVIRDSNPKIFKAIIVEENEIIFKNDDYKNPYEVKYEFLSNSEYRRTITGLENDSLVIYEFNFEKAD